MNKCPECYGPAGDCDHYEWVEVTQFGDTQPRYVAGICRIRCDHARAVPVESFGTVVARLCLDCDEQLGA